MKQFNYFRLLSAMALLLLFAPGCHDSSDLFQQLDQQPSIPVEGTTDSQPGNSANSDSTSSEKVASSVPAGTGVTSSSEPHPLTPDQVCREFIECLKAGNALDAERFLTRTSAVNARKAALTLEPPGSDQAQFDFGVPNFNTNKKLIATVECKITDLIDGEPSETKMSWLLKRDGESWKIAGMILTIDDQGGTDFFSFENPADIELIKQSIVAQ